MRLITITFSSLEADLEKFRGKNDDKKSLSIIILSDFLVEIIASLSRPETVGVIRAALKLGSKNIKALEPYEKYRKRVEFEAKKAFCKARKKEIPPKRIREALQILFASINDAILMPNNSASKFGGREMTDILCEIVAAHLGVKSDFKGRIMKEMRDHSDDLKSNPALMREKITNKRVSRKQGE